jgi:hypothetical protein
VRPFELERGDFLDLQYRDLITKEATIVFINNYAFTSHLEDAIKRDLLSEMKPGTRIISTKPYAPPNRTNITDRRMTGELAPLPCDDRASRNCRHLGDDGRG